MIRCMRTGESKFQHIVDFIRNLYRMPDGVIPLHSPFFGGNEKKYLNECIDSTYVSSVGKFVDEFEIKIAEYTGAKTAVVSVNGTNGLYLALRMAGVSTGDEVITQPLTFVATCNAIAYCGAEPVFLDIEKQTLGMSPESLTAFLQDHVALKNGLAVNKHTGKRISACLPVHTFGHPCRIDEILKICSSYGIPVIEDAAESIGSFYKEKHTGTFGMVGVLSFNGNKALTTGGGGMLLFKDPELGKKAKHLSTQAKISHPWAYVHDQIGYNYRMPNINAALGLAQLEMLEEMIACKRRIASRYLSFFKELDIEFQTEPLHSRSNYWLNSILLSDRMERDHFLKFTNERGIITRPSWTLMNRLPMFQNAFCMDLTNAAEIEAKLVNLPSSVQM